MKQSDRSSAVTELDSRPALAAAIIAASPSMPDPNAHLLWLLSLPEAQLRERLETIRREGCICRAGNYLAHAPEAGAGSTPIPSRLTLQAPAR